jgi:DNA-binding PadR family transcriptional regulator
VCIVAYVAISHVLLGLLEAGPSHGYDLKRAHDELFRTERPLAYGQVYATLARLLKSGLVSADGAESGAGPERKRYSITADGVTDLDRWLTDPLQPAEYLRNTLYTKVVLALMSARDADRILDAQRAEHLTAMREFTRRKLSGDLADQLICDHALLHLEADMKWLDLTAARLSDLAADLRAGSSR